MDKYLHLFLVRGMPPHHEIAGLTINQIRNQLNEKTLERLLKPGGFYEEDIRTILYDAIMKNESHLENEVNLLLDDTNYITRVISIRRK